MTQKRLVSWLGLEIQKKRRETRTVSRFEHWQNTTRISYAGRRLHVHVSFEHWQKHVKVTGEGTDHKICLQDANNTHRSSHHNDTITCNENMKNCLNVHHTSNHSP